MVFGIGFNCLTLKFDDDSCPMLCVTSFFDKLNMPRLNNYCAFKFSPIWFTKLSLFKPSTGNTHVLPTVQRCSFFICFIALNWNKTGRYEISYPLIISFIIIHMIREIWYVASRVFKAYIARCIIIMFMKYIDVEVFVIQNEQLLCN